MELELSLSYADLVSRVSAQLASVIDVDALVSACRQSRYKDRMFYYEGIVQSACQRVFRRHDGQLYWHSGRHWSVLSSTLLRDALRQSLHGLASSFFPSIRSDLYDGLGRLLSQSCNGCIDLGVSRDVVGFRNCVVDFGDIHNPVVHGFDERLPVLFLLDYDYEPDAECPVWRAFLSQVLRPAQIALLQKFLGLGCVSRLSCGHRVESALWLIGNGANGKSTIQGVVEGVFGERMVSSTRLDFLLCRKPEDQMRQMATIVGRAFNFSDEAQESDISRSSDTFKALCSGDKQSFRLLGGNVSVGTEIPYLICNMNRRPDMKCLDKAIVRRLLQINFETEVSEEDMDLSLGEKLRKEYSGIRNWMREGYLMLERDGFRFGSEDVEAENLATMIENGRTVDAYLRAMGFRTRRRAGHWDEKGWWVLSSELYAQYVLWCSAHVSGQDPDTKQAFGRRMGSLTRSRHGNGGTYYELFSDFEIDFGKQQRK